MGGTEIRDTLYQTASRTQSNSSTQVVVFTNGEVSNVDSVVDYIRTAKFKYGNALRFFALGIGDEVSHTLIKGIGRGGGGFAEVVAVDSPDNWDDRVLRMLNGVFTSSNWKLKLSIKDNKEWELASKWTSIVGVGEHLAVELPSNIRRYGYSRRELNELMKPRAARIPSRDEIRKMGRYVDNGCNQLQYRKHDDSDDENGLGGSGGGPGTGPGGSSEGRSGGGAGTGNHSGQTTSQNTSVSSSKNNGPFDSLQEDVDLELHACPQDHDGALFSGEQSSPDSESTFSMILRCFDANVAERLENLLVGVSCPSRETTRVFRTIICMVYSKRASTKISEKDPIKDRMLQRAEHWLGKVIKKRSDRRKLEREALKNWTTGKTLNEKDSFRLSDSEPNIKSELESSVLPDMESSTTDKIPLASPDEHEDEESQPRSQPYTR